MRRLDEERDILSLSDLISLFETFLLSNALAPLLELTNPAM
ncbi:hypothetical protein SAMN05216248_105187 [Pseudomonas simiae]|nr:hypothetical protein SAMN05216248_105187 [Pseudomonas simiae]